MYKKMSRWVIIFEILTSDSCETHVQWAIPKILHTPLWMSKSRGVKRVLFPGDPTGFSRGFPDIQMIFQRFPRGNTSR